MKKTIIKISIAALLIGGTVFTGCQSSDAKIKAAEEKVEKAKLALEEAQKEADAKLIKAANDQEWISFKPAAEEKIKANEIRIAELKAAKKEPGKTFDGVYEKRIDALEQQNKDLQARIDAYDKNHSDWETFKREFNHDMDELGDALRDLTVDNTN